MNVEKKWKNVEKYQAYRFRFVVRTCTSAPPQMLERWKVFIQPSMQPNDTAYKSSQRRCILDLPALLLSDNGRFRTKTDTNY